MGISKMIFLSQYMTFIEDYLGNIHSIRIMLNYLNKYPQVVRIYQAELITAIDLFQKYKASIFYYPKMHELCINSRYLANLLQNNNLPTWDSIQKKLLCSERPIEISKTGELLRNFEFIEAMEEPNKLGAALFLGFYRTYTLVTMPFLKEKDAQVASSLEEMLSILAFEGCKTQLFWSTYHWIVDYKAEGFSEGLALKVNELLKQMSER